MVPTLLITTYMYHIRRCVQLTRKHNKVKTLFDDVTPVHMYMYIYGHRDQLCV